MIHDIGFILLRTYIWLCRFRHRRGYGVHSPFAYNLIKGVFYEQGTYYAYKHLHELYNSNRLSITKRHAERIDKLLFRIANYAVPETIWFCGKEDSPTAEYLKAARPNAHIRILPDKTACRQAIATSTVPDMLCLSSSENSKELLDLMEKRAPIHAVTTWCGIHRNTRVRHQWKQYIERQHTGVTFDLYDVGVIFYNGNLQKQHYIVNF